MAYYSQERKKSVAPKVRALLKEYGLKGSLSVGNHSTVRLTIREGNMDVIANHLMTMKDSHKKTYHTIHDSYLDVNVYWYKEHFSGKVLEFLEKVITVLNEGNHDRSDIMTDYFDVGWYVDVQFGRWDKPYLVKQ